MSIDIPQQPTIMHVETEQAFKQLSQGSGAEYHGPGVYYLTKDGECQGPFTTFGAAASAMDKAAKDKGKVPEQKCIVCGKVLGSEVPSIDGPVLLKSLYRSIHYKGETCSLACHDKAVQQRGYPTTEEPPDQM